MTSFANARVLITGGLGFIGSNLARSLVNLGARVTLVDSLIPQYGGNPHNIADIRDRVQVNVCDVRDRFAIEYLVQDQDFLFNLAGQTSHLDSMTDPQTDLDINASAQLSILEACRKANAGIRVVFASTRRLYGQILRRFAQWLQAAYPDIPITVRQVGLRDGVSNRRYVIVRRVEATFIVTVVSVFVRSRLIRDGIAVSGFTGRRTSSMIHGVLQTWH